MAGLPPSFSTAVTITSSASIDVSGGTRLPPLLTIELYQGNAPTGDRQHVGTYRIAFPAGAPR